MISHIDPPAGTALLSRKIVTSAPPLKARRSRGSSLLCRRFHLPRRPPSRTRERILRWLRRIRAIVGFAMFIEVLASALGYAENVKLVLALATAGATAVFLKVLHIP